MDTQNRVFQLGKRMALRLGESAPLPGIQSVEFSSTQPVDRRGEYDSGQQVSEPGVTEYTATTEMLSNERNDIFQELMGKSAAELTDVTLEGFGRPHMALNIWDRRKTKYIASVFAGAPLYNTLPITTTINEPAVIRLECQPTIISFFPLHAVAAESFTGDGSTVTFDWSANGRTAVQLSHVYGQRFVLDVLEVEELSNGAKEFTSLVSDVTASDGDSVTLTTAPGDGNQVLVIFAYLSAAENSGYAGGTL